MRAMAIEHQVFRGIYAQHYPMVLGYCLRRVARDDAQDIVAEVFTIAWRKHDTMPDGEAVLPWLYAVAARTIANHRRSASRRTSLWTKVRGLAHSASPGVDSVIIQRREDAAVIDAIQALRPGDREILMLSAWEGLSAPLIAGSLGISVDAAEKRLTRAKQRLADALDRQPDTRGGGQ